VSGPLCTHPVWVSPDPTRPSRPLAGISAGSTHEAIGHRSLTSLSPSLPPPPPPSLSAARAEPPAGGLIKCGL
jgi:hypothetical protein